MWRRALLLFALLGLTTAAACSKDPAVERDKHLKQGDAYLAQKKLPEATIEYRLASQVDLRSAEARKKLADAYLTANDFANGLRELTRAADLAPKDASLQLRAGELLLLSGQFDDARVRAEQALALEPANVEALILKGNALAGLKNFDQALTEMNKAIRIDPNAGLAYSTLGLLQWGKGKTKEAEASFVKAVAGSPNDVRPRLALANLYWLSGRKPEAEAAIRGALEVAPKNPTVNQALAYLLMDTNRVSEAEAPFKAIADSLNNATGWLGLADYYINAGRPADAKAIYERLASDPATSSEANIRLASIALRANDRPAASHLLDGVLAKDPRNVRALIGKSNLQLTDGKPDEALATVRTALQYEPSSYQAQYQLGITLMALRNYDEAVAAHKAAIQANPRFAPSDVELARLMLQLGRPNEAVTYARTAVDISPTFVNGHLLLARALLAVGDVKGAELPLSILAQHLPNDPVIQVEVGRLLAARGNNARARQAFQAAITTNPTLSSGLEGLAILDINEKHPEAARARIDRAIQAAPGQVDLYLLAGRIYSGTGDDATAETMLKKAVSVDPNSLDAYQLLASLYVKERKLSQAAEEFRRVTEKQPKSASAFAALGFMQQLQNKLPEAIDSYRKALAIDSRAALPANNLAQIYADKGDNLIEALELAQTAKQALPTSHEVDDTLGWVHYKRKASDQAILVFKRCVEAQPENPVYQYHLGLAYVQNGNRALGRQTLEKALKLSSTFDGADDARKTLQSLGG